MEDNSNLLIKIQFAQNIHVTVQGLVSIVSAVVMKEKKT